MKRIANIDFPTTPEEAETWQRTVTYRALHSRVLIVAVTRVSAEWSAYCVPVPGRSHDAEKHFWQTEGCKVSRKLAITLFPEYTELPYAS